ncbi:YeeE/YedE thiosulfate transporter family protein [Corynebacterium propinquum]
MILTGLGIGALLGIVMQRGRYCVTGMLRDIFLLKSWRGFTSLLILITVHAIGLAVLTSLGLLDVSASNFAPLAVVVGGFIFGLGIVLAGGCASGTWYRSGEGLVGSWVALIFYGLSAAAMRTGPLAGFNDWLSETTVEATTVPEALGLSPWIFVAGLSLLTFFSARYFILKDRARPKVTLDRPWYQRSIGLYTAGALIGVLAIVAWPLSIAAGREGSLGITSPTASLFQWTVAGNNSVINWGTMLVLGLLVGAFVSAKVAGEFRIRIPDKKSMLTAIPGGAMMGVGASLAGGCTVGNGMVQTALFGFQGWVALLFIALGVGVAAKLWLKPETAGAQGPGENTDGSSDATSAATSFQPTDSKGPQRQFNFGGVATGVLDKPKSAAVSDKVREVGHRRYALDTLGAVCPFPLVEAKDVMASLADGDRLVIDFDCTQATDTIPQWAADEGHGIEDFHATGDAGWQVTVVKNGG